MSDSKQRARPRTRWVLLLVVLLLGCLCPYDPYAHLYTTERPNTIDVIGTYVLKRVALPTDDREVLQDEKCLIEIRKDGTFAAANFPIWETTGMTKYKLVRLSSLTGTWNIETVGGVLHSDGKVQSVWGIAFSGIMESASLTGDKPPYGLIFTYGDPDSADVMIFERLK